MAGTCRGTGSCRLNARSMCRWTARIAVWPASSTRGAPWPAVARRYVGERAASAAGMEHALARGTVGRCTDSARSSLPPSGHNTLTTQQASMPGFISDHQYGQWAQVILGRATSETPLARMTTGSSRPPTTWSSPSIQRLASACRAPTKHQELQPPQLPKPHQVRAYGL